MATARVRRGRKTQQLLAEWFRMWGFEGAEPVPASLPGKDIKGMPGWAPEVKATAGQDFLAALRQARANADVGEVPFVIYRPNGYGPERIGEWVVALDLVTFSRLMQQIEGF